MNSSISISECSSGCESGWTTYLDESSYSADQFGRIVDDGEFRGRRRHQGTGYSCEEDDWSIVSDASSGPPHFHEDEDCFATASGYFGYSSSASSSASSAAAAAAASSQQTKKQKKGRIRDSKREQQQQLQNPCLDDTASSPVYICSNKKNKALSNHQVSAEQILDMSQGFSATHFKGKSTLRKHFGFLQASEADIAAAPEKSGRFAG